MANTTFAPTLPVQRHTAREWLPWAIFAGLILCWRSIRRRGTRRHFAIRRHVCA